MKRLLPNIAGFCVIPHLLVGMVPPAVPQSIAWEAFQRNAELPDFLKAILEKNFPSADTLARPTTYEWLPGWVIKPEKGRLHGAQKLLQEIESLRLGDRIKIPAKYLWTTPAHQAVVVAKQIPLQPMSLTKEDIQALTAVAFKAKWRDAQLSNIIKTKNGTLWLIDTEPHFATCATDNDLYDHILHGFLHLSHAGILHKQFLEPWAVEYIRAEHKKVECKKTSH